MLEDAEIRAKVIADAKQAVVERIEIEQKLQDWQLLEHKQKLSPPIKPKRN